MIGQDSWQQGEVRRWPKSGRKLPKLAAQGAATAAPVFCLCRRGEERENGELGL